MFCKTAPPARRYCIALVLLKYCDCNTHVYALLIYMCCTLRKKNIHSFSSLLPLAIWSLFLFEIMPELDYLPP